MRKEMLNVAWLNGAMPIGKGGASGGGGVTINNQDKTVDIADNGTTKITADSGYTGLGTVTVNTNVKAGGGDIPSRPTYTGHADVEGLKAIGWTDEDIAYYQANGVNWNEEDDEYRKVPEDNIALYGVLTASNIKTYKDRIVYLPKIDTTNVTSMYNMFDHCTSLVSIPLLDTTNVKDMSNIFNYCYSLQTANIEGLKFALRVNNTSLLSKESLLYIINNESATSAITIKLSSYCYDKYAEDADVVAALTNHPNISLAK